MKKLLLLIISCLLLTGCTINYNLEIKDNIFNETIKGNVLNEEIKIDEEQTGINFFYDLLTSNQPAIKNNNNLLYNKTLNKKETSIDYSYTFTYNEENITNSRILNECFENFEFIEEDNVYHFITFGKFYCNFTDEIKINITTKNKINYHNAIKEKNNTYTWIVNEDNSDNFELHLAVNKDKNANNSNGTWSILKTIGLVILLILSGICIFILKKKEKEDY